MIPRTSQSIWNMQSCPGMAQNEGVQNYLVTARAVHWRDDDSYLASCEIISNKCWFTPGSTSAIFHAHIGVMGPKQSVINQLVCLSSICGERSSCRNNRRAVRLEASKQWRVMEAALWQRAFRKINRHMIKAGRSTIAFKIMFKCKHLGKKIHLFVYFIYKIRFFWGCWLNLILEGLLAQIWGFGFESLVRPSFVEFVYSSQAYVQKVHRLPFTFQMNLC